MYLFMLELNNNGAKVCANSCGNVLRGFPESSKIYFFAAHEERKGYFFRKLTFRTIRTFNAADLP